MAWTESRTTLAKKLWGEGYSATQIAKELGDVTRNAVIGKIHRLGLARQNGVQQANPYIERRAVERRRAMLRAPFKARPAPKIDEPLPPILGASLYQLNDMTCRYPIGDPQEPGFSFCGRTCYGGPYCAGHARLCYTPVNQRQARATERLANWLDRRTFKQATA